VLPKRLGRDDSGVCERDSDDTPVIAEALRASVDAGKTAATKGSDEGMSMFWRVFGGTLLSIAALVVITLFNNLMTTISELRAEINKLNESRGDLVRKDEFNTRMTSAWDRMQSLQGQTTTQNATLTSYRTELDGIKERLSKQAADTEAVRKDTAAAMDAVKRESAAADIFKERLTAVESTKKDLAVLEGLKERVNAVSADLKTQREDYQRLRQDLDKNQSAGNERKARWDEQYKELEKALKEFQVSLLECQVKVARIEGPATPKPAEKVVGPPKPADER
jgi:DNA repair exonuclease SbcCD ATPase subunit